MLAASLLLLLYSPAPTPCPSRGLFVVVLDAMGVETKASEFSSTGRGEGRERNVSKDK
jgi:hypothetical protein